MTKSDRWPLVEYRVQNPTPIENLKKFLIGKYGTHSRYMGKAINEAVEVWLASQVQQQRLAATSPAAGMPFARVTEEDFDLRIWRNLEKVKNILLEKKDWSGTISRDDFYNLLDEIGLKDKRTHFAYYRAVTKGLAVPLSLGTQLMLKFSPVWVRTIIEIDDVKCEYCEQSFPADLLTTHYKEAHFKRAQYDGKFKEVL
jgi:hypothetical protein